jgi:phenylpyruvate tautomerase PptA (4-oxalocrotonate tautomerase family)
MPVTRISIPACLPLQKARALADAVHDGLVETCNVPPKDRFQFISAYAPEMMLIDPTFPDVRRTAEASIVEILFLEGRTIEQKSRLFQRIADRAMQAGFAGDDIMVTLTENKPTDWSVGYGRSYGDQHEPLSMHCSGIIEGLQVQREV